MFHSIIIDKKSQHSHFSCAGQCSLDSCLIHIITLHEKHIKVAIFNSELLHILKSLLQVYVFFFSIWVNKKQPSSDVSCSCL